MNANHFAWSGVSTPPVSAPAVQRDYVKVKAISLWQPWASLIVLGEKRYETRHWRAGMKRGDVLLIHAAKKWSGELAVYCRDPLVAEVLAKHGITDPKNQLPFGAALGLCRFVAAWKTEDLVPLKKERKFGDYSPDRYAWELELFHVFDKPMVMPGAQGLFNVEIPAALVNDERRAVHEPPLQQPVVIDDHVTEEGKLVEQSLTMAKETPSPSPFPEHREGEKKTMADEVAALESGRVNADIAKLSAKRLIGLIRDECERVEIGGSVRRGKEEVKDVELVIIPKPGLLAKLDAMLANGVIKPGKNRRWGDKHRTFIYEGIDFDLFMADADNWGFIYWLRTGPGDAGSAFMSVLNSRSNFRAIDGHIWHGTKWQRNGEKWESSDRMMMSLPEESDFFGLIGLPVIPPGARTAQTYQPLWSRQHQWGNPTSYKKKAVRADRVDGSRYGMLPAWHPQRDEYERMSPCMWKHNLLPLSIAYYEQRIEEVQAEGKDTFDLERLLEAERERLREGEEAIEKGTMRS